MHMPSFSLVLKWDDGSEGAQDEGSGLLSYDAAAVLTLTATCNLAVFLEGPEASNELPSTSTDMVKMGA